MAFPPIFDHVWDLTQPPDTQLANLLGQDIRNLKDDIMQRLSLLSGTFANRPTPETVNAVWGGAGFGLLYFATDTQQLFQWNGAAWVQITFNSSLVATLNLTGQAAAIAATTFYTAPVGQAGLYRLSSNLLITTAGTGGTIQDLTLWNNGVSAQGPFLLNSLNASVLGNEGSGVGPSMFVAAGQNIQYQVNFVAVTGAPQYSLRMRLEYLT
jgi:hypothetical protein